MSYTYTIKIYTGVFDNAGTDANIYLGIYGEKAHTTKMMLMDNPKINDAERGSIDTYSREFALDLGEIKSITIKHDNSGKNPSWYLEGVRIIADATGKSWDFPANRWLAQDMLDGKMEITLTPGKRVYHYNYIKQYPKDRENGWSNEMNGVCHDANNWFFTQDGNLWKFPITYSLQNKCTSANAAVGILKARLDGYHMGDCDYYGGYVFVPLTHDKYSPKIAAFRASDLKLIATQEMYKINTSSSKVAFGGIGWCAAKDGKLYLSDKHMSENINSSNESWLMVYYINLDALAKGAGNFLSAYTSYCPFNESDQTFKLEHMQGGCFDGNGNLVVTNGYYTGTSSWANSKGGISVFEFKTTKTANGGMISKIIRISHSNQKDTFRYQFDGIGNEPEGITYWNLDKDKRAPGLEGTLHAIMLDNAGSGADDFYFKHYREV